MKRIFLIVVVLFSAFIAQAQQDEKAKGILDKVSENTRSFKSISAAFSFTMQNKEMDINEKKEGVIKLKGQKYCVELPEVGVKVYSDGTTLWNYMKDGNQVTISNIDEESSDLMDPSSLFSIYEKGFKSKFIAEKNEGGKTLYQIELFPDNTIHDVTKISILIDKATMMIHSAQLFETGGNVYGITVKKLETSKDFPDSDFIFNSSNYPDIEVIDFR